jgi:hypothetical protein
MYRPKFTYKLAVMVINQLLLTAHAHISFYTQKAGSNSDE